MSTVSRGNGFENEIANQLEERGWIVASRRHRGGAGDLLALHPDGRRWLVECKTTTRGPFADFLPAQRKLMRDAGQKHDCTLWLVWRAKGKPTRWVPVEGWPKERESNEQPSMPA